MASSFEDDFTVSVEPDLPELFEGPDILAGGIGRLIAVFAPKTHELRRPERLRTRLILSRLALPDHAQCILAVDAAGDLASLEQLRDDFHAVVDVGDRVGLRRQRTKSLASRTIPVATRQMVEARTAFLMSLSLANQPDLAITSGDQLDDLNHADEVTSSPQENGLIARPKPALPAWPEGLLGKGDLPPTRDMAVTLVEGVMIAAQVESRRSIRDRISPYLTLAVQTAFRIDHGVPYLGHPTMGLFVIDSRRWPREDPLKPVRASAFAGWALLGDPSNKIFSDSVRRASSWLMDTVRERTSTTH